MPTEFFVNPRTKKIHMISDFPAPRTVGFTNCGLSRGNLVTCTAALARVIPFTFCKRCRELTGGR